MSNRVYMDSQTYWVLCYRYNGCNVTGVGDEMSYIGDLDVMSYIGDLMS